MGPTGTLQSGRVDTTPGVVTGTLYEADGQTAFLAYQNGVSTAFTYDPYRAGWTRSRPATAAACCSTRDAIGRIAAVDSSRAGEDWTYTYDTLDRLITATNTSPGTLTQSFTYALNGNMLSNSALGAYTYPAATAAACAAHRRPARLQLRQQIRRQERIRTEDEIDNN